MWVHQRAWKTHRILFGANNHGVLIPWGTDWTAGNSSDTAQWQQGCTGIDCVSAYLLRLLESSQQSQEPTSSLNTIKMQTLGCAQKHHGTLQWSTLHKTLLTRLSTSGWQNQIQGSYKASAAEVHGELWGKKGSPQAGCTWSAMPAIFPTGGNQHVCRPREDDFGHRTISTIFCTSPIGKRGILGGRDSLQHTVWLLEEEVPTSSASWSGTLTSLLNTPLRSRLRLP